ncbi:filamentous hemagglutinin N-terminal domain-containing protein [Nostoc sp. UCD121]|uniref:two-partner secretion domain-containing protein n=1 Tax=unclassified Nostoc TaxID=2593658 RepID=UPI001628F304|nr:MULTISPECIES: filamentous hemagglutinin N-terminal domain-containing protein [unclassified Nostoc]MBC1218781.1 filamentous hemagglutinin N-terminal domain-containing protein [Nostoc sp. UCD120]MBC1280167.1 filamentous hemagglutinin N-terminal domain-containing protein [Nostoc sp. UCD121]MBC1294632.1 filamentous hemagglutinin N-terminal domain-containing protein [Nostoc sp. UCD122]
MKVPEKLSILQASYRFWSVQNIPPENLVSRKADRSNILKFWQIGMTLAATSGVIFSGNSAIAQIVPDRTLGAESSVVTPNIDIKGVSSDRIDGGAIRGSGLFHSFQEFNVREGRGAYFSNPAGIDNIFGRVIGSNASNIDGRIGVLGNANLFLLNPNGILFGPNASLDIPGSFLGSTANNLKFGDGKEFSATNPTAPPLLSVSVPLGVQFNQGQPSAIANFGNLSVGQNLSLFGGTVVSTGQLSAPKGQIAVAAVPDDSMVNLNASGQFLNIDTSSSVGAGNSASLAELLTTVDERSRLGLTVNSNGQVELSGSGLSVVDGDVVAKNITAQTATLTAYQNLTLVESQIGTNGDLNLLAGDTVRVRDSVANPFVAQAGGNLTIQGNHGIDILALNHSQTPFVSAGNLSLASDGNISGDARFYSGGRFSILNLVGQPGNFVSLYDPIISANGDIEFGNYSGPALKVESTGRIIGGNITITDSDEFAPNPTNPIPRYPNDVELLRNSRTVILRAGLNSLDYAVNIPTIEAGTNFNPSDASPLTPGSIQVGNIDTSSREGNAGSIILSTIFSANGSISTGSINSRVEGNNVGRAGDITLEASGTITTGGSVNSDVAPGSRGRAGDITLTSRNGEIDTSRGNIVSTTGNERGGAISFEAFGNITTAGVSSFIGAGGDGDGGNITLTSRNGSINTRGKIVSSTPDGNSGNIDLQANGNITIENEIASRILEAGAGTGRAGTIDIISDTGNINLVGEDTPAAIENIRQRNLIRDIRSSTPNEIGGNIRLIASQGQITVTPTGRGQTVQIAPNENDTTGWKLRAESSNGVAGDVTVTALGNIQSPNIIASSRSNINNEGFSTITLNSLQGSVFLDQVQLSGSNDGSNVAADIIINATRGNVVITGTGSRNPEQATILTDGYFGRIIINAGNDVSVIDGFLTAQTLSNLPAPGQNISPQAGVIQLTSQNSNIEINNSSLLTSTESQFASAGMITLNSPGITSINNNSNIENVVRQDAAGQAPRNFTPTITLDSSSVTVTNSTLNAATFGQGNAGNLIINARDQVTFDNANAFTTVEATGTGQGGNISISIPTGSLSLSNDAQLQALTRGRGDAGNIFINATDSVNISGSSSALFTSTEPDSIGSGGNITVGREIRPNLFRISDGAELTASTNNAQQAGSIEINANRVEAINGGRLIAETTSQRGAAGKITVNADRRVNINGNSEVETGFFVRSQSSPSPAGDIIVNAPIVFLDNNGKLIAEAGGSDGGNITLEKGTLLLLRRNSLISTTAGTDQRPGNGGKININYFEGFVIAGFRRNNDIAADAFQDFGGRVTVNALGVVNIEALSLQDLQRLQPETLNPQDLPTNDATANSLTNPAGSGIVEINGIIADPTRATIQLPEDLGDSSKLIAQNCRVGVQGAASSFVISGRGGLPPSPGSALSTDTFLGSAANPSGEQTTSIPVPLQEAQGVEIGSRGQIILTARPSTLTPDISGRSFNGCNGK